MTNDVENKKQARIQSGSRSFRRAVLHGLTVLLPPLLTVLIIVWAINTTKVYLLEPVTRWVGDGLVWYLYDVREDLTSDSPTGKIATVEGHRYQQLPNGVFIPVHVYEAVHRYPVEPMPTTGEGYFRRYVELTYLRPYFAIPVFLFLFILILYFAGKFMAAGIGGFFGGLFERMVLSLPGVRAVYSAVKQVTDFLFSRRELNVTRVVAVEFPSPGIWSMGFVTGEGMMSVEQVAQEPIVTVLIPYSPVPITGCVITVRKSKCIDLDITFDQACQFIVSCGVVVPPTELKQMRLKSANRQEN